MVRTILELQNPDGSFICGIGRDEGASAQDYFPGESLLANLPDMRTGPEMNERLPPFQNLFPTIGRIFGIGQLHALSFGKRTPGPGGVLANRRSFPPTGAKGLNVDELARSFFESPKLR